MAMTLIEKLQVLKHILWWRLTWNRRNTHFKVSVPENPKFMSAREAATLIEDGDVVSTSGLGGNQRASIMYWAIREQFQQTGHPRDLTILSVGGQGGRGIVPGTVEEMGLPGLTTRFIAGHAETFKAQLKLADEGKLELQCVLQGVMAMLFDEQGKGNDSLLTQTGVGTFIDPRVGSGSPILDPDAEQFVTVEDDMLRYRLPKTNVAIFNAPAADRKGNIYARNCAMVGESREIATAARKNGGMAIANVGLLVDEGYGEIFMPAEMVDSIVVYPRTEQTGSIYHPNPKLFFTTNSDVTIEKGIEPLRFINKVLGITPRRTEADNALARLAASTFAENASRGWYVNVGVGLPEEVSRLMFEGGLLEDITFLCESGVMGGLPAPGVFFGAAVNPEKIITSNEMFRFCYDNLNVTTLGLLQADSEGNVNVSHRGEGAAGFVGPGGFIDFTCAADMVNFVGSWMAHAKFDIQNGKLRIAKAGRPKFVDNVDAITFSGSEALKAGKKVFYNTNVGVFKLTERGMELIKVMPGVDIRKDIIEGCPMKVILPESGDVPVVDDSIVTGKGFRLEIQ